MVRLFKGVTRILKDHMQLSDDKLKPVPNPAELSANQRRDIANELKKSSIAYVEYREFGHLISKLVETSELFMGVNQDLIHRENMKRGLGKGNWRSSKQLREATRIMEQLIAFTKNIRLQPISN